MHKEGYYSSGEFAKKANVTVRTIRYYDKQNILKLIWNYILRTIKILFEDLFETIKIINNDKISSCIAKNTWR